jgi:aryl-alcohol dehydrogenase-like predicted oxidoreductase
LTSGVHLDRAVAIVDAMRPIAERRGITVAQLALAWNLAQPGVTSAIAGSRSAKHTRENAEAGDLDVDPGSLADLDALVSDAQASG